MFLTISEDPVRPSAQPSIGASVRHGPHTTQKKLKRMGIWTLVPPTFCFRKMAEEDKSSRYMSGYYDYY